MGRLPSRNGNREERELNGIIEKLNTKSDTPQAIWKANESERKKEEKRLMRGMRMGWKESQPDGRGDRGYICLFFPSHGSRLPIPHRGEPWLSPHG